VAFPETASGVELRILRRLFSEEEAEAALLLSALPEPPGRIFARAPKGRWTRGEFEALLDGLAEKGAIMGGSSGATKGGPKRYSRAMLALGMYELQVDRLTKELQRDLEQYIREGFSAAFLGPKTKQMRTIPVDVRIVPERRVGRYDDARRLIGESSGPWAVINCVCRQGKDLVGEPCRQTSIRRTCLLMKGTARYALEKGIGEAVTGEEVLGLVDRAEREGMVLQPENAQDPLFVCFCCGCCCGVLSMAKQFPRPADYVHSNHHAAIDPALCTDCETCRSRCPMEALHTADGRTAVDEGRCIGCGACVTTCPSEALRLEKKEREAVPPKTHDALYRKILVERFGLLGTAAAMGKAALGRRI
ncbi:MAG TPA: 4Fe-4S dicluster domain-containing protein, partial [Thermoanaerobaculia bacterium]|nr:4Fe-4S dicluster domain-containing protein [Thermoanaerobaculia bacterium]